jgi:hypothetical protein
LRLLELEPDDALMPPPLLLDPLLLELDDPFEDALRPL